MLAAPATWRSPSALHRLIVAWPTEHGFWGDGRMTTPERSTVGGVFEDREEAERAIDELRQAGFGDDQLGFVRRGADGAEASPEVYEDPTSLSGETGTRVEEDATGGALTGGIVGGLIGAAVAGLIPGIGPAVAGGILAATLGGAAVGAAAGGLAGVLIGLGIPEDEARYYEGEIRSGRTIVMVKADGRSREAAATLRRSGAYDVDRRGVAEPRHEQ
jgi:hypothetical protein